MDRVRASEHCDDSTPYDAELYADLLLRSVEVLFLPLGLEGGDIDRMLRRYNGEQQAVQLPLPFPAELPISLLGGCLVSMDPAVHQAVRVDAGTGRLAR